MKGATLFFVVGIDSWPVPKELIISELTHENVGKIKVIAQPNKEMHVICKNCNFKSQAINFSVSDPEFIGCITISDDIDRNIRLIINGQEICSNEVNEQATIYIKKQSKKNKIKSFNTENYRAICMNWSNWRKDKLLDNIQIRSERKELDLASHIGFLTASIDSLKLFMKENPNSTLFQVNVLAHLRALLYWEENKSGLIKPTYQPLLLRVASLLDASLPVFAFIDDFNELENAVSIKSSFHWYQNKATVEQAYPKQFIMDIQEWLKMPAFTSIEYGDISIKELLKLTANTSSAAHFDNSAYKKVEFLKGIKFYESNSLTHYIHGMCEVTIHLGNYLIELYIYQYMTSLISFKHGIEYKWFPRFSFYY